MNNDIDKLSAVNEICHSSQFEGAVIKNPPIPKQYGDELLVFDKGEGCWLFDIEGRKYLDFGSGISVNSLGYGREDLAETAFRQMKKLVHVSNLFATLPQIELADRILSAPIPGNSHADFCAVHFGNSGTEAVETALKYARLYSLASKGKGHSRIIAFSGSFHGRTMGALSVTSTPAYREPFEPLIPDVEILPFNDSSALEKAMDNTVAAVIVEPLQGEGGINLVSGDFAKTLNRLCRQYNTMLIADEVQSGIGRCGSVFASGITGLEPDIITLAKPLAGGLPLSAVLVPEKINRILKPGHHATTFGGGPVTTAVALKSWDILTDPSFMAEVRKKGEFLHSLLRIKLKEYSLDGEIKGLGLLKGLKLKEDKYNGEWCGKIISQTREEGLIILKSGKNVLRFAPPLTIDRDELAKGVEILFKVINKNL